MPYLYSGLYSASPYHYGSYYSPAAYAPAYSYAYARGARPSEVANVGGWGRDGKRG